MAARQDAVARPACWIAKPACRTARDTSNIGTIAIPVQYEAQKMTRRPLRRVDEPTYGAENGRSSAFRALGANASDRRTGGWATRAPDPFEVTGMTNVSVAAMPEGSNGPAQGVAGLEPTLVRAPFPEGIVTIYLVPWRMITPWHGDRISLPSAIQKDSATILIASFCPYTHRVSVVCPPSSGKS